MRCNKCGNPIDNINDYCEVCGSKIRRKKKKPIKLIFILLSEIILTLSFILFFLFIIKDNTKELAPKEFTKTLEKYHFTVEDMTEKYSKEEGLNKYLLAKDKKEDTFFHYAILNKNQEEMFYSLKQQSKQSFHTFFATSISFSNYKYYSIEDKENYSMVIKNNNVILWIGGDIKNKKLIKTITTDLHIIFPSTTVLLLILYLLLVFIVVKIVEWKIFVKARVKGWYIWIPFYHSYWVAKIAFGKGWNFIFMYIPLVNIIYIPVLLYNLSRAFGKSVLFSILNIIFSCINMQIIAFGYSKYTKHKNIEEEKKGKKKKKELPGELIVYHKKKNDDFSYVTEEKEDINTDINKQLYQKIARLQHRNSILLCISIVLYFLSFALFFLFSNLEDDDTLLFPSLILIIIATILLIISKVTKSKDGKIKYKYKNETYFFISTILFGINAFILNDGLTFLTLNDTLPSTLWITELGISVSLLVYYFKSCGTKKKKLKKGIKITLFILSIDISFLIAIPISEKAYKNSDIMYDYSKTLNLVYEQSDRAVAFYKSDKMWYTFTNQYNTNHFELSASNTYDTLNIIYETDNVTISNLSGNDDYAVWCEANNENIGYYYYDVNENQVYELLTIPYSKEMKQIFHITLYKDNIYYGIIDYTEKQVIVVEFNITSSKDRIIYTISDIDDTDLGKNSFHISNHHLLLTAFIKNTPTIISLDLTKPENDSYKTSLLTLNDNISNIYKASMDNNQFMLYYHKDGYDTIEIINKKGKLIQKVYTFQNKEYVSSDKIYFKDNMLYYIKLDQRINMNKMSEYAKLIIYDLENKKSQEIKGIFDYCITKKGIYGLGAYKDNLKNVRLYEIWS